MSVKEKERVRGSKKERGRKSLNENPSYRNKRKSERDRKRDRVSKHFLLHVSRADGNVDAVFFAAWLNFPQEKRANRPALRQKQIKSPDATVSF